MSINRHFSHYSFISLNMLNPIGTDNAREHQSATAWLHSIPVRPNIPDNKNSAGTKNRNCLDSARVVALTAFPIVCAIILQRTTNPVNGKDIHCRRNAMLPIATTSGSPFLNSSMICGANAMPVIEIANKTTKEDFTQNQNAFRTRSNFLPHS